MKRDVGSIPSISWPQNMTSGDQPEPRILTSPSRSQSLPDIGRKSAKTPSVMNPSSKRILFVGGFFFSTILRKISCGEITSECSRQEARVFAFLQIFSISILYFF